MARARIYANSAARQKAYRERATSNRAPPPPTAARAKNRPPSRPSRLAVIEKGLRALLTEYETWLNHLPEFLEDSHQAELLNDAIEQLTTAADLIADITLPLGFGRD